MRKQYVLIRLLGCLLGCFLSSGQAQIQMSDLDEKDGGIEPSPYVMLSDKVEAEEQRQLVMISGLWFDPLSNSEGFNVVDTIQGLMLYYTGFDQNAKPLWLFSDVLPGVIESQQSYRINLHQSQASGANFVTRAWGQLTLSFSGCQAGNANLAGANLQKNFALQRLSYFEGLTCREIPLPESACQVTQCNDSLKYHLTTPLLSANQNSRVRYLILHFTVADEVRSLELLTEEAYQVSAHYLVPEDKKVSSDAYSIFRLVSEYERAWHAGRSSWFSESSLNSTSIGIEIVNGGAYGADAELPIHERRWHPFPQAQIDAVAALSRDIIDRYQIPATRVLGHSDIAPGRKIDPGKLFPWQYLYEQYDIGAWPDVADVTAFKSSETTPTEALVWQEKLAQFGYAIEKTGEWDEQTQWVISTLQQHFRQTKKGAYSTLFMALV